MTEQTKRRPGAPQGNQNRVIAPEQRKRGANMNISMDYDTWTDFKAKVARSQGRALSDDEYKGIWREMCRTMIEDFIGSENP